MKIVEQRPEIPDFGKKCRLYRESTVYFDIETTGLNARRSHLYLLGVMWQEKDTVCLRQWFAERPSDEEIILREFLQFISSFSSLVHFNGTTFDLPYLCSKASFYGLDTAFLKSIPAIDLYQLYRPLKSVLAAEDMKLARLQALCGYSRRDHHTGKELISVYDAFLQTRDSEAQSILEQHNYDDIAGMLWTERLDSLLELKRETIAPSKITTIMSQDQSMLEILCQFSEYLVSLPQSVTFQGITLNIADQSLRILVPVVYGEYYYYHSDWKNYYYLPEEDRAVHKSVGIYVEPSARKKATADTCYTRKTGTFIPEFAPVLTPALQEHPRRADAYYYEITEQFFSDAKALSDYAVHILSYILKHI